MKIASWMSAFAIVIACFGMIGCTVPKEEKDEGEGTMAQDGNTQTTTGGSERDEGIKTAEEVLNLLPEEDRDCTAYDLEKYTSAFWKGQVVYNESVMFVEAEDGSVPDAPLMYRADTILAVRDARLGTLYKEGVDYVLKDGKLVYLEGSSIETVAYKTYYPDEEIPNRSLPRVGGGFLEFSEGTRFHKRQIAVTYIHTGEWCGKVPEYKGALLPKTVAKLKEKRDIRMVLFGDSISTGANSSGVIDYPPYADSWHEMVFSRLGQLYSTDKITWYNRSAPGTVSDWGAKNIERVTDWTPDLVILAFGMNDGSFHVSPSVFKANLQTMMTAVRQVNPDCEFILVSTMLPNPEAKLQAGCQEEYVSVMQELETEGVALANVTDIHKYLLEQKRYYDMTGNNVNHPNDFLARVYAQVVLATLVEDY